jgi:hypothetical protein
MAPSGPKIAPFLRTLTDRWRSTYDAATVIANGRKTLMNFGEVARRINEAGTRLNELTESVAADKLRRGGSAREAADAERLVVLHQRIAKNANLVIRRKPPAPRTPIPWAGICRRCPRWCSPCWAPAKAICAPGCSNCSAATATSWQRSRQR